jgi:hypothetical protein
VLGASVFGYARRHSLASQNVAERIDKLPAEGAGASRVIEEVLTPAELAPSTPQWIYIAHPLR